jgi:hypothetical protein
MCGQHFDALRSLAATVVSSRRYSVGPPTTLILGTAHVTTARILRPWSGRVTQHLPREKRGGHGGLRPLATDLAIDTAPKLGRKITHSSTVAAEAQPLNSPEFGNSTLETRAGGRYALRDR